MRKTLTFEQNYKGYEIQNTQEGALIGCLDKSYNLLTKMLVKHSQVLLNGFCCTYPDDGIKRDYSNQTFLLFLQKFTDHLRHQGYDPKFIWCREHKQGDSKPHWHFTLLLNANKIRYLENSYASNLWNQTINAGNNYGCLQQTDLGGMMRGMIVKRGDEQGFADAIYKMSYLGKVESKTNIPTDIRRYGSSQLN